ncbi:protein WALLS ARE THIN 1 [Tanacetum coccineum]
MLKRSILLTDGDHFPDPILYRTVVVSLVYLTVTLSDIAYVVHIVSKFVVAPTTIHWATVLQILRRNVTVDTTMYTKGWFGVRTTMTGVGIAREGDDFVGTCKNKAVNLIEKVRLDRKDGTSKVAGTIFCIVGAPVITLFKGPTIYSPSPSLNSVRAASPMLQSLGDANGKRCGRIRDCICCTDMVHRPWWPGLCDLVANGGGSGGWWWYEEEDEDGEKI